MNGRMEANGSSCSWFFLYESLLAIWHAPRSPTVTWACCLTMSLPRCFHHPLFIILSWPLCCACALLNCFKHLQEFVRLQAIIFLSWEIYVSILYEAVWLWSNLPESMALNNKVCAHEYLSELSSKCLEQIHGSATWVTYDWRVLLHNATITCCQI